MNESPIRQSGLRHKATSNLETRQQRPIPGYHARRNHPPSQNNLLIEHLGLDQLGTDRRRRRNRSSLTMAGLPLVAVVSVDLVAVAVAVAGHLQAFLA